MKKSRVEALTDGIVAIAATIMVLELKAPAVVDWGGLVELWHVFLAYINSFLLIYIAWSMHHDLFQRAQVLSRRAFAINGIWVFLLTLIPFTTSCVGAAPDDFLPEFLYPMHLLLWCAAFHWLDHQVTLDNPGTARKSPEKFPTRVILYISFGVCMIAAFIKPILSIFLIGITAAGVFIRLFAAAKKKQTAPGDGNDDGCGAGGFQV